MSPEDIANIAQILRNLPSQKVSPPAFLKHVEDIPEGRVVDHPQTGVEVICYAPDGLETRQHLGHIQTSSLTPVWCIVSPSVSFEDHHQVITTVDGLRAHGIDVVARIWCATGVFEHLRNMRNAQRIENSIDEKSDNERKRKL